MVGKGPYTRDAELLVLILLLEQRPLNIVVCCLLASPLSFAGHKEIFKFAAHRATHTVRSMAGCTNLYLLEDF